MCYCSSILRGVTAVLLSFWDACREKSAADAPKQLNTTCRLINCMRKVKASQERIVKRRMCARKTIWYF